MQLVEAARLVKGFPLSVQSKIPMVNFGLAVSVLMRGLSGRIVEEGVSHIVPEGHTVPQPTADYDFASHALRRGYMETAQLEDFGLRYGQHYDITESGEVTKLASLQGTPIRIRIIYFIALE